MTDSREAAEKIMALVDEFPSGPLSFERKDVLARLEDLVAKHTQQIDNERDESYEMGKEDGYSEAYEEVRDEYESQIEELSERVAESEEESKRAYDEGFASGLEAAGQQNH